MMVAGGRGACGIIVLSTQVMLILMANIYMVLSSSQLLLLSYLIHISRRAFTEQAFKIFS